MNPNISVEKGKESTETMYACPFCKCSFDEFIILSEDGKKESWESKVCPHCFSTERERMYKIFLEKATNFNDKWKRVLYLGQEDNVINWLMGDPKVYCTVLSFDNNQDNREKMDFENETFDVILCSDDLNEKENNVVFLKELYRVLRKDGYILIQNPSDFSLLGKVMKELDFRGEYVSVAQALQGEIELPLDRYGLPANNRFYIITRKTARSLAVSSELNSFAPSAKNSIYHYDALSAREPVTLFTLIRRWWRKLIGAEV